MNLARILQQQALERPGAPALVESSRGRDRVTTFAELEERSRRLAAAFYDLGLRPGDHLLLFVPMSAALYTLLSAIFRSGLVATFIDPAARRQDFDYACELVRPRAFVAVPRAHLLRLFSSALRHIPHAISVGGALPRALSWRSLLAAPPREDLLDPVLPDHPALVTFTSGSTGRPKAAVRTHGFLIAQHAALVPAIGLEPGQVDLGTLPIFTLANLASGLSTIIPDADLRRPGQIDAAPILRQIERHRVTRCTASPAFFERLADYAESTGLLLPTLNQVFTGGAPVHPRLLDRLRRLAPNARITAVYGSTEAEPIAHLSWDEISAADRNAMAGGSGLLAGTPEPSIALRILPWGRPAAGSAPMSGREFDSLHQPPGTPGEIVVSGDHVLRGYLHGVGDEQTKIPIVGDDGVVRIWHRTGDAGLLDDKGRLWLLGRCEARIQDERGTLFPFAVETAALEFAGVRRAALLAHQGRRLLIVEGDVPEGLRRGLAWARIDEILPVPRIPVDKRHNAKVDYPALRRLIAQRT